MEKIKTNTNLDFQNTVNDIESEDAKSVEPNKKDVDIKNLLKSIIDEKFDDSKIDDYVGKFQNIYTDGFRHSYANLTQYMLKEMLDYKTDDIAIEIIKNLASYLKGISKNYLNES